MSNQLVYAFVVIAAIAFLTGCAGVKGQPERVRRILEDRYVGQPLTRVIDDLGAPDSSFELDDGRTVYTWRRQTSKYSSNVLIRSDERCVVTMYTDSTGQTIESIGGVDDSLGAFNFSYCAEQLGLTD